MEFVYDELTRGDKTSVISACLMKHILLNGHNLKVGLREINVNIGKGKPNLRIDVLEINKKKNELVGYEIKSCIQDFRTDKKWEKYLDLVNQLYFVFDDKTFNDHEEEILEKVKNKAGIYIYNTKCKWICLKQGVKFTELPEKTEEFYRTILFNYLFRQGRDILNRLEN